MVTTTAPKLASLPGVRVFATCDVRGRRWTLADLSAIARNFRDLGPGGANLTQVPVVLGHSEADAFDDDQTGKPAFGWVKAVRVRPYKDRRTGQWEAFLEADFEGLPPGVVRLLRQRAYATVSSEIYDSYRDDFQREFGPSLRRVALLGGSPCQIKRLGPIDVNRLTYSERRTAGRGFRLVASGSVRGGVSSFYTFTEATAVDRQTLMDAIRAVAPGLSDSWFDGIGDEKLKELVAQLSPDDADDTDDTATAPTPGGGAGGMQFGDGADQADVKEALGLAKKFAEQMTPRQLAQCGHRDVRSYVEGHAKALRRNPRGAREMVSAFREGIAATARGKG